MLFMREIERDRLRLLTIVLNGRDEWRRIGGNAMRGLKADTELLDAMYDYFRLQAAPPAFQRQLLDHAQNAVKTREIVRNLTPELEVQRETLKLMEKWSPVQKAGWHG